MASTYTTPTTQADTNLIDETIWNRDITDNIKHLHEAVNSIIVLEDQQTSGTNGGTFTQDAWQTRTLNTEVTDVNGVCSLSSNQFTLDAGTYEIYAVAPAYQVGGHQTRLQNTTAASTILTGSVGHVNASVAAITHSFINGRFTVAASQALEIQHYCNVTKATTGFGLAASITTEVYTRVWLRKVA